MLFNVVGPSSKFVKTAIVTGVPFGLIMSIFYVFGFSLLPLWFLFGFSLMPPVFSVAFGMVSGVFFGVFCGAFASYQGRKFASENPCRPGEELVKHGSANHFLRLEGVGGYLYLTTERLLFKSHKLNIQNHELSIPLEDVTSARSSLTAGFVPNGLKVVSANRREHFAVEDRRGWAEEIRKAKAQGTGKIPER